MGAKERKIFSPYYHILVLNYVNYFVYTKKWRVVKKIKGLVPLQA